MASSLPLELWSLILDEANREQSFSTFASLRLVCSTFYQLCLHGKVRIEKDYLSLPSNLKKVTTHAFIANLYENVSLEAKVKTLFVQSCAEDPFTISAQTLQKAHVSCAEGRFMELDVEEVETLCVEGDLVLSKPCKVRELTWTSFSLNQLEERLTAIFCLINETVEKVSLFESNGEFCDMPPFTYAKLRFLQGMSPQHAQLPNLSVCKQHFSTQNFDAPILSYYRYFCRDTKRYIINAFVDYYFRTSDTLVFLDKDVDFSLIDRADEVVLLLRYQPEEQYLERIASVVTYMSENICSNACDKLWKLIERKE